ncbi:MobF family relaxase [Corynebacterium silvaticum]|uniref:MobF family relaxase n=1 Tax=Corynebacterium silvaticum TaxID=2320431 RepID=UPI00217E1EC9|nr:MobF family relaxase [Corynebacterium silvaticum]UWH01005.1 relaxase domain-containing protein [Corynebacterium silvaticum]UWH03051.1 relaxase domain-containing protein [Corynebacterium silvaticum]UXZ27250.1 relaxase domain-containing protein [Corynebacterium silvaticum]UXZ29279.1 relaxase domain-containing protein [Corynebacterium silvaticum]UXZ31331.1 relaxase domain-containing protein [Corynebacterium silvaticum]
MLSISTIKAGQAAALSDYYSAKVSAGELTPEQAIERQVADRAAEIAEGRGLSDEDAMALAKREQLMKSGLAATQGAGAYYKSAEEKPRLVWIKGGGPKGARVTDEQLLAHLQGFTADGSRRLLDAHPKRLQAIARELGMADDAVMEGPALAAVREGLHPETGAPLEGRAAKMARAAWAAKDHSDTQVTTYDLTFSAPKGLSVLAGFGDEKLRERIIGLHEQAADAAMEWAETADIFAVSRGHAREIALGATPLQTMRKTELSSRAGDPLISHVLMSAAAVGDDGRRTTLDGRSVYHASRVIRSRYEATLATLVQEEMGITIALNEAGVREVVGFDEGVLEQYSKRSAEVAEKLAELQRADRLLVTRVESDRLGYEEAAERRDAGVPLDAEQAQMADDWDRYEQVLREWASGRVATSTRQKASLESRSTKGELSEQEQLRVWATAADRPDVARLLGDVRRVTQGQRQAATVESVVAAALARATSDASVIRQKDLVASLHEVWPAAWPMENLLTVQQALMQSEELLQLTEHTLLQPGAWTRGQGVEFTTRTAVAQESRIEAMATALAHDGGECFDPRVTAQWAERYTLTDDQAALLAAATRGTRLVVAEAPAGAGKTHTLSPLVAQYQQLGYETIGVSTKAQTAAALAEAGVVRTASLARLEMWAEKGRWDDGISPEMALQGEAWRTAVRQASTPEERAAAQAGLDAWEEQAAELPHRLQAEKEELQREWAAFKASPPHDSSERQQAYESLRARGADLQERAPKTMEEARNRVLLVLDEAAMSSNDQLEKVLRLAGQRGWTTVMAGDSRQLQGIGRSTGFGLIADAAGRVEISETYRARDAVERQLQVAWQDAESLVEGRVPEGAEAAEAMLEYWQERGRVHIQTVGQLEEAARERPDAKNPAEEEVIEEIARRYVDHQEAQPDVDRLALARTNRGVGQLAEAIQREQIRRGLIDEQLPAASLVDQKRGLTQTIRQGESIRITKNVAKSAIRNGQVGVVRAVNPDGSIRVSLPTGVGGAMKTETIRAEHLTRGYAALGCATTGHGAQGRTVEQAWVLADAGADREWLYPAMTRAKSGTDLHWVTDAPDRAPEEIRDAMLTTGAEASALQVARTHPTPAQRAAAAHHLEARGQVATPEAVATMASQLQAVEAAKREQQRAELGWLRRAA